MTEIDYRGYFLILHMRIKKIKKNSIYSNFYLAVLILSSGFYTNPPSSVRETGKFQLYRLLAREFSYSLQISVCGYIKKSGTI